MNDLIAIAHQTFWRIARQKSLYFLLGACVVLVGTMNLYGVLSVGREKAMMLDAALALMVVVALVTGMASGFEIPRELKSRTAELVLSKPLGRVQFLVGKLLGMMALTVFNVGLVAVGSYVTMRLNNGAVPVYYWSGAVLIAGEGLVLCSLGVLLSLLLSDMIAVSGVFVLFAIGHAVPMLPRLFDQGVGHGIAVGVASILPNLGVLDFKALIAYGMAVDASVVLPGVAYALAYSIAVTALAVAIFQHKDIH